MDQPKEVLPARELDWKFEHPLLKVANSGQGFICFHTQNLKPNDVEQAIDQERSIEIDVTQVGPSFGRYPEERVVMAHTPWMNLTHGKRIPTTEELESPVGIVDEIANRNVFVKFDVKSPEVIPWTIEQAKKIKAHLRMVHAFVGILHAISVKGEVKDAYIFSTRGSYSRWYFNIEHSVFAKWMSEAPCIRGEEKLADGRICSEVLKWYKSGAAL